MTAIDASSDDRTALARELQWLGSMLPLGDGQEIYDGVADDRVAAIVATALLALPSRVADEAITRALAAVGLQRGVDRAFYYELDEAAGTVTLTHEWHAPHLRPMKTHPQFAQMPLEVLPHQFLGAPVSALVPPDGDRALVMTPVIVDGGLLGIAGFAAHVGATWDHGDLDLLQLVAQGVARTVERKRVDDALHAAESRFRAMCDASPLGIFLAAKNGDGLYLNPSGERMLGLSSEEMAGRGWINALHPEDR